jgi:hypothetical protein
MPRPRDERMISTPMVQVSETVTAIERSGPRTVELACAALAVGIRK